MHNDIFLFSVFPILGLILSISNINRKKLWAIAIISFIILLPSFQEQVYLTNQWIDNTAIMLICACGYAIFSMDYLKKTGIFIGYIIPIIMNVLILLGTFVYGFFAYFGGDNYVIKQCRINNYRLDFIESRGFSGRPGYYENLYEEYLFGLYSYKLTLSKSITENNNSYIIQGKQYDFCK